MAITIRLMNTATITGQPCASHVSPGLIVVTLGLASCVGIPTASAADRAPFAFVEQSPASLQLREGDRPVLVYNHGIISPEGVAADRARSTYVHPLYGLDGEVLTDDFPTDHYHHRGLFWAWPHVRVGGKHYDLWMLQGIQQRFERWLVREPAREGAAVLGVENGWYVGDKKVMLEEAWFRVHPATSSTRAIDVEFLWLPLNEPITLSGAEGKSYGGLTLRYAPRTDTVITTPLGQDTNDLAMTRLPWADLSARFQGASDFSGAAVLISPKHPGFPPMWLTRHYGCLCVGWPGVTELTFSPGQPIRCGYRVLVHRGKANRDLLSRAYEEYQAGTPGEWVAAVSSPPPQSSSAPQRLDAQVETDRVSIRVNGQSFTEYLFLEDAKYPYFYPVLGPRSRETVTVHKTEPYPHHSSVFFGCDRVNGGNYWQEGIERGRIVSLGVRMLYDTGPAIEFEQDCAWQRPGAEAPFNDHRHIRITAPDADTRCIDFDVTLTARTEVKIEKTNHSLFAVRVAPVLSVQGGGTLVNAQGATSEKGTFGEPAPWADYSGSRNGIREGVTILSHPSNPWFPERWFTRDYGFMSPTPLNWIDEEGLTVRKGTSLRLRYRVVVHAGETPPETINRWFTEWRGGTSHPK